MGLRYTSPLTQVIIVGFICFLCPGMFNALNGMGGGGQVDASTGANGNTALYSTFVVFGIIGGGIVNLCGVRWTIFGSGFTYALYSASYIYLNETKKGGLTIAAGALLGIGAWYSCLGSVLGLALAPPSRVVRDDGSSVVMVKYTNVGTEALEIVKLFLNPMMISLLPLCFASNFFYGYQFNAINGAIFNLRTRGFNNIIYWGAQMVGAYAISFVLDNKNMNRKKRGIIGFATVAIFFNVVWGGTLALQQKYTHGPTTTGPTDYPGGPIDFKDSSRAGGPITLYFVCGFGDAIYQSFAYWVIGALTNDNQKLSRYVGFYKGMQSFGAAISWQLEAKGVDFMGQLIVSMAYVVWNIKDHSEDTVAAEDEVVHEKIAAGAV
ncbi:hypothetical protein DL89DRAFT_264227 [Linderina pennispora]|uniref:MFS general substrate transporter n=1 Tax=Linderina pennispora TaxID=61395 RepID=A0A1Y1WLY4_9FUNG|nr:uncharacterized protein DL89DRAFT_264227 [Linderina pennispora]ORX74308.1 hypothetical protein DL89DRAFT_264227 [Linderina pennispora]